MGKVTGFLEYQRELPTRRPPAERIEDWLEIYLDFFLLEEKAPCAGSSLHGLRRALLPHRLPTH